MTTEAGIDLEKVKVKEVKDVLSILNDSGLLEKPIQIKGRKARSLAISFCKAVEKLADDGKLQEIPVEAFEYYGQIVPAEEEPKVKTKGKQKNQKNGEKSQAEEQPEEKAQTEVAEKSPKEKPKPARKPKPKRKAATKEKPKPKKKVPPKPKEKPKPKKKVPPKPKEKPKPKPKKKAAPKKKATAKKAPPKKKATAKPKRERVKGRVASPTPKAGVIATIILLIERSGPVSKDEILDQLTNSFPDRERSAMSKTISCQIGGKKRPFRLEKEKHVKLVIDKEGKYSMKKKPVRKKKAA